MQNEATKACQYISIPDRPRVLLENNTNEEFVIWGHPMTARHVLGFLTASTSKPWRPIISRPWTEALLPALSWWNATCFMGSNSMVDRVIMSPWRTRHLSVLGLCVCAYVCGKYERETKERDRMRNKKENKTYKTPVDSKFSSQMVQAHTLHP